MVRSNRFFLVNFSRRDFVDDFVQAHNPKLLPVGYRHSLIADDIVTRGPIRPFVTKTKKNIVYRGYLFSLHAVCVIFVIQFVIMRDNTILNEICTSLIITWFTVFSQSNVGLE